MVLETRIKMSISRKKSDVVLKNEFTAMGSEAQVTRVLRNLVNEGFIVRMGVGVYAKAKISVISKKPIPVRPVSVLAPEALKKLGVNVFPSTMAREYNEGKTTQIPRDNVVNTGRRRIRRKLGFGNQTIKYENDYAGRA